MSFIVFIWQNKASVTITQDCVHDVAWDGIKNISSALLVCHHQCIGWCSRALDKPPVMSRYIQFVATGYCARRKSPFLFGRSWNVIKCCSSVKKHRPSSYNKQMNSRFTSFPPYAQHAYDMIHYISGLFGYFYVCEIYVNLIWYLYLFMLNKFCLSLSLSLSYFVKEIPSVTNDAWKVV